MGENLNLLDTNWKIHWTPGESNQFSSTQPNFGTYLILKKGWGYLATNFWVSGIKPPCPPDLCDRCAWASCKLALCWHLELHHCCCLIAFRHLDTKLSWLDIPGYEVCSLLQTGSHITYLGLSCKKCHSWGHLAMLNVEPCFLNMIFLRCFSFPTCPKHADLFNLTISPQASYRRFRWRSSWKGSNQRPLAFGWAAFRWWWLLNAVLEKVWFFETVWGPNWHIMLSPDSHSGAVPCEDLFCLEYFSGVSSVVLGFRFLAQTIQIHAACSFWIEWMEILNVSIGLDCFFLKVFLESAL